MATKPPKEKRDLFEVLERLTHHLHDIDPTTIVRIDVPNETAKNQLLREVAQGMREHLLYTSARRGIALSLDKVFQINGISFHLRTQT